MQIFDENKKNEISVGILCGGKSRRMGRDKSGLRIKDETFLERLCGEFKEYEDKIISLAEGQSISCKGEFTFVYDEKKDAGPLEGIRQVLLASRNERVFICAVDMPFLTKQLLEYMQGYISSDYDCYVAVDKGKLHPLCGIYSRSLIKEIDQLLTADEHKVRHIFQRCKVKYIELEHTIFSNRDVLNINTRKEYRALCQNRVLAVSGTKNSGKTTLIEKLIKELKNRDYKTAVIKHDIHGFELDREGTDTSRFSKAGSTITVIYDNESYGILGRNSLEVSQILEQIEKQVDLVLCEGFKDADMNKIIVARAESFEPYNYAGNILAVAADFQPVNSQYKVPIFDINDVRGICDLLESYIEG